MDTLSDVQTAAQRQHDEPAEFSPALVTAVRRALLSDPETALAPSLTEPVRARRVSVEWRRSVDLAAGRRRPV